MRVTNQMMTNTSLSNINKNKQLMSKLENQYSTQKKISSPSDDPIVAVRALKLRKNLEELNQYYEKNIPDAMSWMDTTEGALTNMNEILTSIHTLLTQGANDTLSSSNRDSIMQTLTEYKNQIYQEGNANYAGRYIFSGYKTDTSLVFDKNTTNLEYSIQEEFKGSDIDVINVIVGGYTLEDYDPANPDATVFDTEPRLEEVYRLRLSYGKLNHEVGTEVSFKIGENEYEAMVVSATDPNAYSTVDGPKLIAETGELILPKDLYDESRNNSISITYSKNSFEQYDLRPEHYFNCTSIDTSVVDAEPVVYTVSNQEIKYDINFNQNLVINTQGKDAITHDIGREIDELYTLVGEVQEVENRIAEVDKMLAKEGIQEDEKEALTALKGQLENELTLKNKVLQERFSGGLTTVTECQDKLNVAIASLGSRYTRLELTETRLANQQVEYEELLSTNEDVDLVQIIVRYNSQQVTYNASLSAAAKIVKSSLLDFI